MLKILMLSGVALAAATTADARPAAFRVTVDGTVHGRFQAGQYANAFGCSGGNVSPRIVWSGEPAGTKSFVVTVYDPDAPTGSGWWHWVVKDIPASAHELAKGTTDGNLPRGAVQVTGDAGVAGYTGPCPPQGEDHHYIVTVWALKTDRLNVPPNASPAMVGFATHMAQIGQARTVIRAAR